MDEDVIKWLHSPTGRGKRQSVTQSGCYILEHDATGRIYLGESLQVSVEVDKQLKQLTTGTHPCKLLNELYKRDSAIRVYEYQKSGGRARKALLKRLRDTPRYGYFIINDD